MTIRAVIAILLCFAGPASALAQDADWQGVWVAEGLNCPTAEQIVALENGVFRQGPHWQFFDGVHCEALNGKALEGTRAQAVTGLCRRFGKLQSQTWRFERTDTREARVFDIESDMLTLTRCDG